MIKDNFLKNCAAPLGGSHGSQGSRGSQFGNHWPTTYQFLHCKGPVIIFGRRPRSLLLWPWVSYCHVSYSFLDELNSNNSTWGFYMLQNLAIFSTSRSAAYHCTLSKRLRASP